MPALCCTRGDAVAEPYRMLANFSVEVVSGSYGELRTRNPVDCIIRGRRGSTFHYPYIAYLILPFDLNSPITPFPNPISQPSFSKLT